MCWDMEPLLCVPPNKIAYLGISQEKGAHGDLVGTPFTARLQVPMCSLQGWCHPKSPPTFGRTSRERKRQVLGGTRQRMRHSS